MTSNNINIFMTTVDYRQKFIATVVDVVKEFIIITIVIVLTTDMNKTVQVYLYLIHDPKDVTRCMCFEYRIFQLVWEYHLLLGLLYLWTLWQIHMDVSV